MVSKLFGQIRRRKFTAGIALLVIISGGYFGFQGLSGNVTAVQYVPLLLNKAHSSYQYQVLDR